MCYPLIFLLLLTEKYQFFRSVAKLPLLSLLCLSSMRKWRSYFCVGYEVACSLCIWIEILKIKYIEYTANSYLTLSALTCSWPYLLGFHGHYSFSFLLNECKTDIILELEQEGVIDWPLHTRAQSQSSYGLEFSGNNKLFSFIILCVYLVTQSCLTLCSPTRLLRPWDSPGKSTGVCCHALLQGIFPTQGSNPCLLRWQAGSSLLSHLESPPLSFPPLNP